MKTAIALVAGSLALSSSAAAQPWTDRVYINAGGAYQVTALTFADVARPIDFAERAVINTSYDVRSLPGLDIGGGVRVWRNLAVGLDVERMTKTTGADVSADVPHPFFFERARAVSGRASGLRHEETAVHLQALWMIPMTSRLQLGLAAGPSRFSLKQDLVTDVTVTQTYPYDMAAFASSVSARRTKSGTGYHAGMTVDYLFSRHVGAGFTARYAHARVRLDSADTGTVGVDAGGGHVGVGLRLRF